MTSNTNKELLLNSIYNDRFKADLLQKLLGILHSIIDDELYTLEEAGNEITELIMCFNDCFDYLSYYTISNLPTTEENSDD